MPSRMPRSWRQTMREWAASALFVAVEDHLEPDENGDTEAPGLLLAQLRYLALLNFMRRERLSVEKLGGKPAGPNIHAGAPPGARAFPY